jgi:FAD/FMN-containing dehydrogenase
LPKPVAANDDVLEQFADTIGRQNIITDTSEMEPFLVEWRDRYQGAARAILKPGSTEEVAALLKTAHKNRTPIVPQGGNTGLVGGQIPFDGNEDFVLSLSRLNKIREIDPQGNTMTAEAGVVLQKIQDEAANAGRFFPLSLGSEGSCQIGGNLASNAGGTAVLAYGNARDLVLGLEVVTAKGQIWHGLRKLKKDNTGYDLKNLFIGSEGTLGIITAAVLKLFPAPRAKATAFVGVESPEAALMLFNQTLEAVGSQLTAFEFLPRIGLDFVLTHATGTRDPFVDEHPWYVLMELTSGIEDTLEDVVESILSGAFETGRIGDATIARSEAEAQSLWRIRLLLSEVQKHEGGSIKHDVSVPVAAMPTFLRAATAEVERRIPKARVVPFGHLGDGNVHFNVSQPVGAPKQDFLNRWEELNNAVHGIVAEFGGSVSAEHGIGVMKRELMGEIKSDVELELMRNVKRALDPRGILNPGKMLPG